MPTPTFDIHLQPTDLAEALRHDVGVGLSATPKWLPPKWFYDDHGSDLFDQITRLPEYYPTEREREILKREAGAIAELSAADTFIELGSGTGDKTRTLLDAFRATGRLQRFVPFDVCEPIVRQSAAQLSEQYPGLQVHGVVGDFERHLDTLPRGGRRMVAMLGGTIGNLVPNERAAFLQEVVKDLGSGDSFLVGTDLVKDEDRLVRAYDDSAGVTAAFNRNLLTVLNRELGADFDPDAFEHVAVFDTQFEWIEMRLRAVGPQKAWVPALDLAVEFEDGEEVRTEISAKFRKEGIERELSAAGLEVAHLWTDAAGDFALTLATKS